jgi:putative tryptophan/tyrosine transport system substrate-binding protein
MRRIGLAVVLAVSLTLAPLVAEAQQTGKVYRIGWLAPASLPTTLDAFRDGLRVFGYVEGNNLVIEQRYANGRPERLAGLVAELVGAKADVIVTTGNQATAAAKTTTGSIPVVFVAGDPVEAGFVASLARPGGNMTGVNTLPGVNAKRLELLKEALPKVSRVAVLFEPRQLSTTIPQIEAAASSLGLQITRLEVHGAYDFERALAAAARSHVGALMPVSSALFHGERQRIVSLAAKHRLPAMYEHRDFADAGGLLSYGPDILFLSRRVAAYVDKILKGAKPADLPVEQPTKFELVINLKTAKVLGLTIPQTILLQAAQVID